MRNFKDTFETGKRSFISAFSIFMTAPLIFFFFAEACNVLKSNTPPWVFFTFLKLHKRYQITQSITYMVIWRTLKQLKTRYLFPFFLFYLQNLIIKVLSIYGRRMTQLNSLIINFINSKQMWKIERNYGSGKILLVAYQEK